MLITPSLLSSIFWGFNCFYTVSKKSWHFSVKTPFLPSPCCMPESGEKFVVGEGELETAWLTLHCLAPVRTPVNYQPNPIMTIIVATNRTHKKFPTHFGGFDSIPDLFECLDYLIMIIHDTSITAWHTAVNSVVYLVWVRKRQPSTFHQSFWNRLKCRHLPKAQLWPSLLKEAWGRLLRPRSKNLMTPRL